MEPTTTKTAARIERALANLSGPGVASVARPLTCGGELMEAEKSLTARAAPVRRREFAVGRHCARAALQRLGCTAAAIGRGRLGEPLWPARYGGSITHGRAFAAAVAYRADGGRVWAADLVDEPDRSVFESLAGPVLGRAEARRLGGRGRPSAEAVATAFAAKEAAIKITSPRLGRYVDFLELQVERGVDGLVVHGPLGVPVRARHALVDDVLVCVAEASSGPPLRN